MLGVGRLHLVVLVGWISIFFYPYRKTIIKVEAPTKEFMDVLTNTDQHTSISKMSSLIHNNGDYHREFHVWIYVERARDLLLHCQEDCKDSWPNNLMQTVMMVEVVVCASWGPCWGFCIGGGEG